ncbi:zinc C2H2 type domain-containing protein [Babesia caballi]|uniref:Zinc C2H2 type domain-containing protein n=1 Tax=Babesia caballi TaxID=5871 RepID=A0AAV4LYF5_BABCB|nr:zinc C2H2 type domain-containing protein [Babesia caballi]
MTTKTVTGLCFLKPAAKAAAPATQEANKCVTCNTLFPDVTAQKSHFKSEWHLYNVKRKGAGIDTVGHADFLVLKERLAQMMAIKNSELETKNKAKPQRARRASRTDGRRAELSQGGEVCPDTAAPPSGATSVPYDPVTCLFSGKKARSVAENLKWMARTYSFFVPEEEYLTDAEALLGYLHDKIYNQNACIYCQRAFGSTYAVLHHMEQKQHRKLNDEDIEEIRQFYDFTKSYLALLPAKSAEDSSCGSTAVDDEDEWEDVITAKTDTQEALQRLAYYGIVRARINEGGNLSLPNGREAVHRDVSYVYKQNLVVRGAYGVSKAPTGFKFLKNSDKRKIARAEKQKRTKLEHGALKMQYKSYKLFVPCNQIAYAT